MKMRKSRSSKTSIDVGAWQTLGSTKMDKLKRTRRPVSLWEPPDWVYHVEDRLQAIDQARAELDRQHKQLRELIAKENLAEVFSRFSQLGGVTATDWQRWTRCNESDYDGNFIGAVRSNVVSK